jgi:hypothetical protein
MAAEISLRLKAIAGEPLIRFDDTGHAPFFPPAETSSLFRTN